MNADEEEAKKLLPIADDRSMRLIFGSAHLRAATLSIMKRNIKFSGDEKMALGQVRTTLFTENYQLKRCLSERTGGAHSEVR